MNTQALMPNGRDWPGRTVQDEADFNAALTLNEKNWSELDCSSKMNSHMNTALNPTSSLERQIQVNTALLANGENILDFTSH